MKSFLEYVAEDIVRKYGTDLSRTAVVFPNKRASLFLNEYLAKAAGGSPLWSPVYITISELFRQQSTLTVADPIKLVCDLHLSFCLQTDSDETLDKFYGWGQLLISDFDDLDKNMADADHVFANLRDIHELDDLSYLTDEQRQLLRHFFSQFTEEHETELQQRFLRLWSRFADIYHDFNERLAEQGLAYEGALYRQVCQTLTTDTTEQFPYDRYLFVGFNLLQKVEQQLFSHLKDAGKAYFYWDFDHYYMPHSVAARSTALSGRTAHGHRALRREPAAHRHPLSARRGSEGQRHHGLSPVADPRRLVCPALLQHAAGRAQSTTGAHLPAPPLREIPGGEW